MKGRFDFFNLQLHKNKSKLIIPKAIYNYFIHDIMPHDYLDKNRNILDYCIGSKSKGAWKQVARYVKKEYIMKRTFKKLTDTIFLNQELKLLK